MTRPSIFAAALALLVFSPSLCSPASAQDTAPNQLSFGRAVAMGTGSVFVGAPVDVNTPGRVFVYSRAEDDTWTESTFLEAEQGTVGDGFGAALDVSGDTLVVGAPSANAAYVFHREGGDWTQTSRLTPSDSTTGFGRSAVIAGDRLFVGTKTSIADHEGDTTRSGAVHVFRRTDGGDWSEVAILRSDSLPAGAGFSSALLAGGDQLFVGAPRHEGGAVSVFRETDTGWTEQEVLMDPELGTQARFGGSLERMGRHLLVGASGANGARGTVASFTYRTRDTTWIRTDRLSSEADPGGQFFGHALAAHDSTLWVGAPSGISMLFLYQTRALQSWPGGDRGSDEGGAVYRYQRTDAGWSQSDRVRHSGAEAGDGFGATLAADGSVLTVGLPGDDFGAGTVGFYDLPRGEWTHSTPVAPTGGAVFEPMTGREQACEDGRIGAFPCEKVGLKSFLPIRSVGGRRGIHLTDVWGWTDPKTGTEYALVGRADGTSFVDVSDPTAPVLVGDLPMTDGTRANTWRDVKVYQNHAFVVADNVGDHGMQVFDLTRLRDVSPDERPVTFDEDAVYDRINSAHNLVVNPETGYAYAVGSSGGGETCGGALHMINVQAPENPQFAGCFAHQSTGQTGPGYTHDAHCIVYDGPDPEYQGREICIGANETALSIADVTDKDSAYAVAKATYPDFGYVHQGWFGTNERYFYQNDEYDEIQGKVDRTRTLVWDLKDLDNPTLVKEVFLSTPASDHNQYVQGSLMYEANYKAGLQILDLSDPTSPTEVAHFDTKPFGPNSPGFAGAWSNYPYFENGTVVVTSIDEGLFVLEKPRKGL